MYRELFTEKDGTERREDNKTYLIGTPGEPTNAETGS